MSEESDPLYETLTYTLPRSDGNMSTLPPGGNTPPPPQDGGNIGGEPAEQAMGDQPWEEPVEEGGEEGGLAVGAQNPELLEGEDAIMGEGPDGDEGEFGENTGANNSVQGQQSTAGAANEHTNYEDNAALIRPVTAGWIKPDGRYDDNESFIPLPKLTFLVDRPDNLTCRLCLVSELRVSMEDLEVTDRTPAIMPCGHIAGALCLHEAIESMDLGHWACPFCRYPLTYVQCEHRLPEKVLTAETIRSVPATLPNGGVVPELCPECRALRVQWGYREIISDMRSDLITARANYAANGTEEAARQLAEFARLFEELPVTEEKRVARIRSGIGSW